MVPPVWVISPAISLKVSLSSVFNEHMNTPSVKSTSSAGTSQSNAARSFICSMTSVAVFSTARPVSKVMRLPNEPEVKPMESVSATDGFTSSAFMPSASAACIARATRVPDRSAEPVIRLMVPLPLTLIVADDPLPPPCIRYPTATPRPWYMPSSGAL